MKDFFKKYPALIIFIGVGVLITIIFVFYEIMYNTQNKEQQNQYDDLNKTAWITEDGEEESEEISPEDKERLENEAKMKAFLEAVEDPDFFKDQLKSRPNFDTYWEINEDVIGYVLIPDSNIGYPILRNESKRDYYLKKNIDGTKGYPGCIFVENINGADFKDPVTISYGHNMANGTMYGQLHKFYRDAAFREAHKYVFVYQPESVSLYEIVAATSYSDLHLLADDFIKDGNSFMFGGVKADDQINVMKHLKEYGDKNAYFKDEELTESDKLFVMATCSSSRMRIIVAGKLLFTHQY
ncbi:MAG: class B sortase [Lachnospiraceae bacterium]|nr:class B sortase [Lachnospiraceae bacterium]